MNYYFYAVLLALGLFGSAFLTLIGLPGNWLMVGLTAFFAFFFPVVGTVGISWTVVAVLAGLALIGEVLEFGLGAASLAKGGSKQGALLAVIGSFLGSILGATLGSSIPVIGPIFGIVVFASVGAMVGAVIGELRTGKSTELSLEIGKAAFWGRLLGSVAKIVIGSVILAVATIAAFL